MKYLIKTTIIYKQHYNPASRSPAVAENTLHIPIKYAENKFEIRDRNKKRFCVLTCCMQKSKKDWQIKLGIFLMIFSGVFFAMALIIPLLGLPVRTAVIGATASFILMEVIFWTGGLLVGKELFMRYKKRLNPLSWFKKN